MGAIRLPDRFGINNRSLSVIVFSTFSAWLLAFPFEGQLLYSIADQYQVDPHLLIFGSLALHLVGLLGGGFVVRSMQAAKQLMLYVTAGCLAVSSLFFFSPSALWYALLPASLLAGLWVAAWGFYFCRYTPPTQRIGTAADGLIYSNLLMIAVNLMAVHLSPQIGLAAAIILLVSSFYFSLSLPERPSPLDPVVPPRPGTARPGIAAPLGLLCLFVVVITVNSGLMYQVINPAFEHHQWLVSWYWAVPYIVALWVVKRLPQRSNRAHLLYVAMAMIGFAFIAFMGLDRSVPSYLLVDTLMLGACGVFDLFWWSILGEMLDLGGNPAKVLGFGLAANVLGVLLGGMLGKYVTVSGELLLNPSVVALGIVMLALVILPALHQRLSRLLQNHAFLSTLFSLSRDEQTTAVDQLASLGNLTERERQIVDLLSRGRTYRLIADELFVSENTVKTHVRNTYSKLGINSKAELVQLLLRQERD